MGPTPTQRGRPGVLRLPESLFAGRGGMFHVFSVLPGTSQINERAFFSLNCTIHRCLGKCQNFTHLPSQTICQFRVYYKWGIPAIGGPWSLVGGFPGGTVFLLLLCSSPSFLPSPALLVLRKQIHLLRLNDIQ